MNILWITNILLPKAAEAIGLNAPVIGGWMQSSAKAILQENKSLKLAVATVSPCVLDIKRIEKDNVIYFILPLKEDKTKYQKSLEPLWRRIYDDFQPNVVHLHGTEYAHGLAYQNACPKENIVVSIQGLMSVCYHYYCCGLTDRDILNNITFRDVVKRCNLWQQKQKFRQRGEIEKQILRNVNHIIGRTSWDKAHVWAINPNAEYHFCNEILRSGFYGKSWQYDKCEPYSIFVSQAGYPIKGLHQLLKAMPLVLRHYPSAKIYVAGGDITKTDTFNDKLRLSGYGSYIKRLIKKLELTDKIQFTGPLDEKSMIERYLRSNLFLSPSAIENSSNSLGEAQLLGVPCIASYVGGTADLMKENENCLYRFEEIEMLADKICRVFGDYSFSVNVQELAKQRHDAKLNAKRLIEIYNKMGLDDDN